MPSLQLEKTPNLAQFNNSPWTGGNCSGTLTSEGYNLSSDGTCNFNRPGDLNNHDPMLGPLQNNGGPTQTRLYCPEARRLMGATQVAAPTARVIY